MALQICPQCHLLEMTWAVDEELSPYTYWHCTHCIGVVVWEDENKEKACHFCHAKQHYGMLYLWNKNSVFWYCTTCTKTEIMADTLPNWIEP